MKKLFVSTLAIAAALSACADSPLWLRNAAISPDGKSVAFTYRGNIFSVPVSGGEARQITSHKAYDTTPVWSPDGKSIMFASDREGSMDIFVVDAAGGTPRRVTTASGKETPLAFLNDSTILYSSNVLPLAAAAQPGILSQVYAVGIDGGRPRTFASTAMGAADVAPDGRVLYHDIKGYEDPLRKHERSSGTSDIWLIDNGRYTRLTDFNGHDFSPRWVPGSDTYCYLSEQDGVMNVYSRSLDGRESQLTHFERHPVRGLSVSDGGIMAFSWNGEIYTLAPGGEPARVHVQIVSDDYDSDRVKDYRTSGATTLAVSPGGEEVAFVLRGDVYVTSVKYKTTKRVTDTGAQERVVAFSPDGRKLVYDSERDGVWQLFMAEIKDPAEKGFAYASEIVETPLYRGDEPAQQPEFSPDGKKVAFLYGRNELRVIDIDSREVTTALDGRYNYSYSDGDVSYEWSPDSRWFLTSYIGVGGWNNPDVALVKADGSQVVDLTESGYSDGDARWVLDGKGLTYTTGRYGYRSHGSWGEESDVVLMVLDPEAWDDFNLSEEEAALKKEAEEKADDDKKTDDKKTDKKSSKKDGKKAAKKAGKTSDADKADDEVEPLVFDLDNRRYRTARLTSSSSRLVDYWLSKKGDKLYYIARATEGGTNLMVKDLKKGDTKVLVKGVGQSGIIADKEGENLYLLSGGGISKISIPDGEEKSVDFEAPYSRHPSAEREYMFDHVVRQVADKFYDADIHGVDWDCYAADYRRFLPYVSNNYDFAELLSELLGELNASHTGARYHAPGAPLSTASLGVFVDEDHQGQGLKVSEVIARGPLSTKAANVQPGDIILAIDGDTIETGADYYPLLEGKAGKKVRLMVRKPDGSTVASEVRPVSSVRDLLYDRWVERNERLVDSISAGKVGYVHVRGMDSDSYRTVYSRLLGKYRNCDAVVVDTRYNGGGWLHNDIAILLSGKEYVRYSPRGQFIGIDPFSQWTKPSVMLVNECNYSDAHGTPYVYQTLGIGDVVGAPVPGTMTAVWWEDLIDPTLLFGIPEVTSLGSDGRPLENHQLDPDILIYNNPADEQLGIDAQLIGAVEALMGR